MKPIAKLAKNIGRNIIRVLRDEINAHPFGADQSRDLLHLIDQGFGGVVKQQVRLVKEENELWFIRVANFGEVFEKFRQHP